MFERDAELGADRRAEVLKLGAQGLDVGEKFGVALLRAADETVRKEALKALEYRVAKTAIILGLLATLESRTERERPHLTPTALDNGRRFPRGRSGGDVNMGCVRPGP